MKPKDAIVLWFLVLVFLSVVAEWLTGAGASCPYSSESTDALNRTCAYACAAGATSITVKITETCPISIDR